MLSKDEIEYISAVEDTNSDSQYVAKLSAVLQKSKKKMMWIGGWKEIAPQRKHNGWAVVYMDSHSRFIVSYGLYDKPTAENALDTLLQGIENYGVPRGIFTNNKSPFTSPPDKAEDEYLFDRVLTNFSILHFHLTEIQNRLIPFWNDWKKKAGFFKTFDNYVRWFNEDRPHSALNYAFPYEVFNDLPIQKTT